MIRVEVGEEISEQSDDWRPFDTTKRGPIRDPRERLKLFRTRRDGDTTRDEPELVAAGGSVGLLVGLLIPGQRLAHLLQLVELDLDALVAEEQVVADERAAALGDEEDGLATAGVAELDDGVLQPAAALTEGELRVSR
jgi:hypothetical protein